MYVYLGKPPKNRRKRAIFYLLSGIWCCVCGVAGYLFIPAKAAHGIEENVYVLGMFLLIALVSFAGSIAACLKN